MNLKFGKQNLRMSLLGFQFFISIFLITCTLVMYRQMKAIENHELGINHTAILHVQVPPPASHGLLDQPDPPVVQQPKFIGGMEAFYSYVEDELQYPLEARQKGIEGQVEVQFVVEKDGSLSNVLAISGIGAGCDEEAVRVIKNSPAFDPGKQRGNPVRVRMVLPILFSLNSSDQNSLPSGNINVKEVDQRNGALKVDAEYADGYWSGTVKDPEGNVLPGATIIVAGTDKGSVTDIKGDFVIKTSLSEQILIIFVGYESVRLKGN